MSTEKRDGPEYHDTKQIPRVVVPGNTLDAVLTEVRAMRDESRVSNQELTEKVDTLSLNVDALQHDAKDTRLRLGRMERELDEVKDRQANNSVRVRGESEVNLKQDSAIAEVVTKVRAIEENQAKAAEERAETAEYVKEIRDTVVKSASSVKTFFTHPKVVFVGKTIFALAVAYSAAKGIKVVP